MTARIASRMQGIAPFRVMQILARARALEATGHEVVHMEVGEPDFATPQPIVEAGHAALAAGHTHYTPAAGLPALREAIAGYYAQRYGVSVDPARILITPGASGALQLVLGVLVDPGDEVLVTDPGYPCNRHMVEMFGGVARSLRLDGENGYAFPHAELVQAINPKTRALMLATPANPTGGVLEPAELAAIRAQMAIRSDLALIVDEIYQGLQYAGSDHTALALAGEHVFVINSFSKYFGMTGWRLGWVVAPPEYVEAMERLAQNIFLAASTPAQYAALAAFSPAAHTIMQQRREIFRGRRDFLYQALDDLGFGLAGMPQGAFYIYADAARFGDDSLVLCDRILERCAVAITPGLDFGSYRADTHVRFAYTTGLAALETGVMRLRELLRAGG